MSPNVIIIHGAYGYPDENWFGWLKQELSFLNINCQVPALPTPEGQNLNSWIEVFRKETEGLITSKTILIGHSLGAAFALKWLEKYPNPLYSLILVGTFLGSVGYDQFDSINKSFFANEPAWDLIKTCCHKIYCYHGNNDPYVSRSQFDFISNNLSAKRIIVSNAGHFNAASGYTQFPQLLFLLTQIIESYSNA